MSVGRVSIDRPGVRFLVPTCTRAFDARLLPGSRVDLVPRATRGARAVALFLIYRAAHGTRCAVPFSPCWCWFRSPLRFAFAVLPFCFAFPRLPPAAAFLFCAATAAAYSISPPPHRPLRAPCCLPACAPVRPALPAPFSRCHYTCPLPTFLPAFDDLFLVGPPRPTPARGARAFSQVAHALPAVRCLPATPFSTRVARCFAFCAFTHGLFVPTFAVRRICRLVFPIPLHHQFGIRVPPPLRRRGFPIHHRYIPSQFHAPSALVPSPLYLLPALLPCLCPLLFTIPKLIFRGTPSIARHTRSCAGSTLRACMGSRRRPRTCRRYVGPVSPGHDVFYCSVLLDLSARRFVRCHRRFAAARARAAARRGAQHGARTRARAAAPRFRAFARSTAAPARAVLPDRAARSAARARRRVRFACRRDVVVLVPGDGVQVAVFLCSPFRCLVGWLPRYVLDGRSVAALRALC